MVRVRRARLFSARWNEQRLGRSPDAWLVDGGFPAHEQIDAVAGKTEVYAPVPEPKARKDGKKDAKTREQGKEVQPDKHQPKPGDSQAVAQWRARNGRAGRMRGREMTEDTQTRPLSEAWASITRIGDAIRSRVGAVAVNSNGRGVHADFEKLSASEPDRSGSAQHLSVEVRRPIG